MNHPSTTPINKSKDNTVFDINKFNIDFEKQQREKQEKTKLIKTETEKEKQLHEYTIGELVKDYIDNIIKITDELILFRYNNLDDFLNIFLKNNRLLYIGITLLFLTLLLFLLRNTSNQ